MVVSNAYRGGVQHNAYQYVKNFIILAEYNCQRQSVEFVLDELKNKGLYLCNVPQEFKQEKNILLSAQKAGHFLYVRDFPDALKNDKDFMLGLIEAYRKSINKRYFDFTKFSPNLQVDEDIGKAFLTAGYPPSRILAKMPHLLQSREAMMAAVEFPNNRRVCIDCRLAIGKSRFIDELEFMLNAHKCDPATFGKASERLRSDPVFVRQVLDDALDGSFIADTTENFQVENLDVVVAAIELGPHGTEDNEYMYWDRHWSRRLCRPVWTHKQIIMACLKKGWSILEYIASIDANNPHLSDQDVIRLAAENNPDDFKHASVTLRQDREFVLSLVSEVDRLLHHAAAVEVNTLLRFANTSLRVSS